MLLLILKVVAICGELFPLSQIHVLESKTESSLGVKGKGFVNLLGFQGIDADLHAVSSKLLAASFDDKPSGAFNDDAHLRSVNVVHSRHSLIVRVEWHIKDVFVTLLAHLWDFDT